MRWICKVKDVHPLYFVLPSAKLGFPFFQDDFYSTVNFFSPGDDKHIQKKLNMYLRLG